MKASPLLLLCALCCVHFAVAVGWLDVTDWHLHRCRKTCETQFRCPPSCYHLETGDLAFFFFFLQCYVDNYFMCSMWGLSAMKLQRATHISCYGNLSSWCQRHTGNKSGDHVAGTLHGSESTGGSSVTNMCTKKPWKSKGSDEITLTTSMKHEWFAIRSEFVLQSSGVRLYPIYIYFEAINPQLWSLPIWKSVEGLTASSVFLPSDMWEGKFTARDKEELCKFSL